MRKCFIWLPQGRLGNLIFQFQAISAISDRGLIFAFDSEFFDLFERPRRFLVIPCFKRLRWRLVRLWISVFQTLARRHWLGTIEPGNQIVVDDFKWETWDACWKQGYFANIFLVKGFFQTPRYVEPLPRMKQGILQKAERRLAEVPKAGRVAIHMRFGDYSHWPLFGVPGAACLPASYYLNALAMIKKAVPAAHFLVLSDEPDKARSILDSAGVAERITFVAGGTAQEDFALMACCSHAVLSASSFSWWAAMFITNSDPLRIAPKYWLGFRRKIWFPPGLESSRFVYIDPLAD
jgi:hypothetical protein